MGVSGQDVVRARREGGGPGKPPGGGGPVLTLLIIAAVVAIGACGYFGFRYVERSAVAGTAIASAAPSSLPAVQVAATLGDTQIWTDDDTRHCEAVVRAAAQTPLAPEMVGANSAVTDSNFAALASMVACKTTTKIARLCNPDAKAALVADVKDYVGRLDVALLGLKAQTGLMDMMVGVTSGMEGGDEVKGGNAVYHMEQDATMLYIKSYHDKVAAGLKALVRANLVSPGDFGAFMSMGVPETIDNMLKGAVPDHTVCV